MNGPSLRQIHLDFHTSPLITPIAERFDPGQFARTMAEAHVNSVNVFAKCLHGYSYYPTAVGTTHPGLSRDLFGEQVAALQASGIKAQAYVGVLWDNLAAELHPEWVAVDADGRLLARPVWSDESVLYGDRGWSVLDLASGFAGYVLAQVEEICERYRPDGFWFDIVSVMPNYSPAGVRRMQESGVDVGRPEAVRDFYLEVRRRFVDDVATIVRRHLPEATIFHNHTTDSWVAQTLAGQNQLDVESLPTDGAWGYLHYPVMARYARTFGPPVVGMTGRFHRSWADFGGLKTADQLRYEVGTILSAGGSPSIGDQLDPSGALDPAVYRTIGQVFADAEALAPWLDGSEPMTEAAIVATWVDAKADAGRVTQAFSPGVLGAVQMLMELAVQFDVVDASRLEPGKYRLLIVADDAVPTRSDWAAISRCREAGAALLTCGAVEGPEAPVKVTGPVATTPSFFRAGGLATGGLDPDFPYVCYGQASVLEATVPDATVGVMVESRFNRTWDHFTSHLNSPVGETEAGPLAVVAAGWGHVALPAFSDYAAEAYWPVKAVVSAVIDQLLPVRLLRHDGPPWVEASLHRLASSGRERDALVIHLTSYQPRRSSAATPRLDVTHPLAGFPIAVTTEVGPQRVYLAPGGEPVPFEVTGSQVVVQPTVVSPHTLIVIE
jgi:hypothetical protein